MGSKEDSEIKGYILRGDVVASGTSCDCGGLIASETSSLEPAEGEVLDRCRLARPGVCIKIFDYSSQRFWRGDGDSRVNIVTEEVSEETTC